jgi:serine/threonine-protein kinase
MELAPGALIAARFRLEELLGKGGMGEVWRATHVGLDSPCAVKFLGVKDLLSSEDSRSRFEREAKAAAALRSRHVVRILDHGLSDEIPYIAMELLEGEDLEHCLARRRTLPPAETLTIAAQVGRALSAAHAIGIVHRDIKPANIFLAREDGDTVIKVLDFGIAKRSALDVQSFRATASGAIMGTPMYMSPEQVRGSKKIDTRADLWSLAVIVYECLTGRVPFAAESIGDLVLAVCSGARPVPSQVAEVPPAFDPWWARAAAIDINDRFQTVQALLDGLTEALGAPRGSTSSSQHLIRTYDEVSGLDETATAVAADTMDSDRVVISPNPGASSGSGEVAAPTGKYRVITELGRGGMATVHLVLVRGPGGFNKLQVVKRLRPALAADPDFLKMFLEEARLAARINHPGVVQTNEVGFDGGHHFITMEYLDGQSLQSIVRAGPNGESEEDWGARLPLPMFLRILAEALEALHFAHELSDFTGEPLRVVHRDLSPHNLFVTYEGHVKLLDFGIAKAADSSEDTRTGILKGKCAYMAPEQFRGTVDRRTDLFAAGIIMWQALTRTRMWPGLSDAEIFQRLATGDIKTPRSVRPDVPEVLEKICMRALAIAPADRFQTAAEFQAAVEDYLQTVPRVTAQDIGKTVSAMFVESRAKLRKLIEEQIQLAAREGDASSSQKRAAFESATPSTGSVTKPVEAKTARGGRRALLGAVFAGVVLVTGFFVAPRLAAPRAATNPKPESVSTVAAGPSATPRVTLSIRATPPQATIFIDDAPIPGNPATATLVRDGAAHTVRAEAPQYAPTGKLVTFDTSNLFVDLALERAEVTTKDKDPAAHDPAAHQKTSGKPRPASSNATPPGASAVVATPPPTPTASGAATSGNLTGLDKDVDSMWGSHPKTNPPIKDDPSKK